MIKRNSIFTATKLMVIPTLLLSLLYSNAALAIKVDAFVSQQPISTQNNIPVFSSIQAAINAVSKQNNNKYIIEIKAGTYTERVNINKANISLVGSGNSPAETVISFGLYAGHVPEGQINSIGTFKTATLEVNAADFYAENLTIENSFDYPAIEQRDHVNSKNTSGKQAVALTTGVNSNRSVFNNIILKGYQDTLFINGGINYFYNSKIYGHVDFIFGAGNALFEKSTIINQRRHRPFKHTGFITAPSTLIGQQHGFTFIDCRFEKVAGVPDKSVPLGRPWHPTTQFKDGRYANPDAIGKAVFIRSFLDSHITDEGWTSMHGTARDGSKSDEFFPDKARFFEYKNYGPGAKVNDHRRQLTSKQSEKYTKNNILNGWQPVLNTSKSTQSD